VQWLFEAKKRYGLSILNYMVTSNHVHLLVADDESDAISRSIQLVAGNLTAEKVVRVHIGKIVIMQPQLRVGSIFCVAWFIWI